MNLRVSHRSPAAGAYSEGFINSKLTQVIWGETADMFVLTNVSAIGVDATKAQLMPCFVHCAGLRDRVPRHKVPLLPQDRRDHGMVRSSISLLLWILQVRRNLVCLHWLYYHWALCRYPTNPVLRLVTPQDTVRNLDVYPVKLTQDAILVDVSGAATTKFKSARGGSDTSIDNNNVFSIEPRVYVEGTTPEGEQ